MQAQLVFHLLSILYVYRCLVFLCLLSHTDRASYIATQYTDNYTYIYLYCEVIFAWLPSNLLHACLVYWLHIVQRSELIKLCNVQYQTCLLYIYTGVQYLIKTTLCQFIHRSFTIPLQLYLISNNQTLSALWLCTYFQLSTNGSYALTVICTNHQYNS